MQPPGRNQGVAFAGLAQGDIEGGWRFECGNGEANLALPDAKPILLEGRLVVLSMGTVRIFVLIAE